MIGTTISHYRLVSQLGEGGMGVVYEAEDLVLGRKVALKFCSRTRDNPRLRSNLLKEARAASALSHPNIAHIYDFVDVPGADPFIVMELVSGATLRRILAERRLTVAETFDVATGVASALAEAHRRGIVHRDIKPGNIQLTANGEVKVLDFGIAQVVAASADPGAATMTLENTAGTPLYMSPEQASEAPVDGRSDLFSLGVVLYECVAGRSPFVADTTISVVAKLLSFNPPEPSRLNPSSSPRLDRITLKLLEKDPQDRYQSAEELLADLRTGPRFHLTRRQVGVLAAAGSVCALGGVSAWVWSRGRRPGPAAAALPWYRDGAAALHNGGYYRASKALARAVELDPGYPMAHAYLAEAWYELDYLERAKDELLKAITARSSLPRAEELHLEAMRLTMTGDFKGAAQEFQEMAALSGPADRLAALLDLGRAQERNQEARPALATYAEAVRLDPQSAAAHLRLGTIEARVGDRESATKSLERAQSLFESASDVEGVAECLYVRARYTRTPQQARALLDQAMDAARVTGHEQQQIKLLQLSSGVRLDAGQTVQALEEANRAISIARAAGIENLASRGLIDLGNALFIQGRVADAEKYMQEALEIARRNREKRSEARALVNLGSLRIQSGDTAQGWQDVGSALAYYRQGSYRNEGAIALILLGRAARNKGDYEGARRAFEETLGTVRPSGPSVQLALAQEGLASVLALEDRWPQALQAFDETRRVFDAIGNPGGSATNVLNVGLMHALLGHAKEAAASLAAAPEAASEQPDPTALQIILTLERFAEARAKAARLLAKADAGDLDTQRAASLALGLALARSAGVGALAACRKAADLARAVHKPAAEAEALLACAEAALEAGDRTTAAGCSGRARAYFTTAHKPESLWRACVLAARAGASKEDAATQAADALRQLATLWPAEDFRSYLSRPLIRRLHQELLRLNPQAPAATTSS